MSLLDGYEEQQKKQSLLDGYEEKPTNTSSLLDGYNETSSPQGNLLNENETSSPKTLQGGITQNVRTYESRFPDRNKNFFANAGKDVKDTVSGLAGMVGNTANFLVGRPLMSVVKDHKFFTGEGIQDLKNLKDSLPQLKEGLKENYGQGGIDMFNAERIKEGKLPIKFDPYGFAQSFYAHPLNLLDLVGLGEAGKIGQVRNLTKGGQLSKFSKNVGNKVVSPKYSGNIALNLGERALETKPVQAVVNAIDNSPFRPTTDVVADFLGLSPESRLMGTKGAEVRQAKLIEQANQTKNIAERNKAIAENNELLNGLSDVEAKQLIQNIESGGNTFKVTEPLYTDKTAKLAQKNIQNEIKELIQPETKLDYEVGKSKKGFFRWNSSDPITQGLHDADVELNNIIKEIKKNPEIVNDTQKLEEFENRLIKKTGFPDDDINEAYFTKFYQALDKANDYNQVAKDLAASKSGIATVSKLENLTPEQLKVKDLLRDKVQKNADFYIEKGLLDEQTVHDLPINTYASIKYNKPISELSDIEKVDALKDIERLPKEQQPFYVPMMYDDKLRAGDFFANTTKRYKPNELKQRKVGMGLEENKTGGKRVYNPVELANRLDAHRIKMVNTENMINEIIDNFAKPLDLSNEKVLDGYVPFNPDAFMKFYRKSIDLNDLTLRKLDELQNIDTALKTSVEEAIKTLPEDIIELMGAFKNNKIYQIPEDVAKTLMSGKNQKNIWEAMFDMSTAGFKRKVLGLSPKWFINNRIGNGIMAGLKGVNPADYIKALKISDDLLPEALRTKSMYEAEKTIIGRTGGGDNGFFGNTMRLLGGEFIDTSELKGLQKAGIQAANALGIPGKVMNTITDKMFAFNQIFEDWERRAAYIHSANKVGKNTLFDNISKKIMKTTGQNIVKQDELLKNIVNNEELLSEVMKNVDNTLGDYINMTATERRVIRKMIPFYSWFRTITRYTLSLPESNPIRTNLANKISMALAEENEDRPEYQRAGIDTGFTADKTGKPILLNYEHSIPFSTFGETADNPTGLLNPIITQSLEAARGRREFMDRPFTSRNYENVFPNGYASLKPDTLGEYTNELPITERLMSLPVSLARTSMPGLDWFERVGLGSIQNLIQNGELTPKDALFDTSFGGYNYKDGFVKKPKGWSNEEQLIKLLLPIQQAGKARGKVKTKRQAVKSLYEQLIGE